MIKPLWFFIATELDKWETQYALRSYAKACRLVFSSMHDISATRTNPVIPFLRAVLVGPPGVGAVPHGAATVGTKRVWANVRLVEVSCVVFRWAAKKPNRPILQPKISDDAWNI